MKTEPLFIMIPIMTRRQWTVNYAPEFRDNCTTTGSLSGYGTLEELLAKNPEFRGLPVIDLNASPREAQSASWRYPLDRLPQYAKRADQVQPFKEAFLDHLRTCGVTIYPAP